MRFAVWAPNAEIVTVIGEFNEWDTRRHPMRLRNGGVWEIFMPGRGEGAAYKYNVRSPLHGLSAAEGRPVWLSARCRRNRRRSLRISTATSGGRRSGWKRARRRTG